MLPVVGSTIFAVYKVTYMADSDTGEMFLNFMLSEEARPFYGVNVKNVQTK